MNNVINTNQQSQAQMYKQARENLIFQTLKAQSKSKTIENPQGRLLRNTGIVADAAIGTVDTAKDGINFFNALKNGKSSDSALGRMNDLGLKIGGFGIAAYLMTQKASKTSKMMEFVGFATFLASMKLWPKLFIELPLKLKNGFDINRKYKDSQGNKKSFFLDNQYLPWDLWSKEEINKIGDKMQVDKDMKDREEFIKRKMQKTALQGNTLWMLTAGFATPLMTSMICNRLEKPIEKFNVKHTFKTAKKQIANMDIDANRAAENAKDLTEKIAVILNSKQVDITKMSKRLTYLFIPEGSIMEDARRYLGEDILQVLKLRVANSGDRLAESLAKNLEDICVTSFSSEGEIIERAVDKDFIKSMLGDVDLGNDKNLLETLKNAFVKHGIEIDESKLTESVRETRATMFSGLDSLLAKTFKTHVAPLEVKMKLSKGLMNSTIGEQAESFTAYTYRQISSELLSELGVSFKDLKKAKQTGEEAFAIVSKGLAKKATKDANGGYSCYITFLDNLLGRQMKHAESIDDVVLQVQGGISESISKTVRNLDDSTFGHFKSAFLSEIQGNSDITMKSGVLNALRRFSENAKINIDSIGSRILMSADFENRLETTNLRSRLHALAEKFGYSKDRYEEFVDFCRRILYSDNMNVFSNKNNITSREVYLGVMEALFTDELSPVTAEVCKRHGFLETLQRTRDSIFLTAMGIDCKEFPNHSMTPQELLDPRFKGRFDDFVTKLKDYQRTEFIKPILSQDKQYKVMGKPISELFQEASNQAFNNKKWFKIFGGASIALAVITLVTQSFFGKMKEQNLYKKNNEAKNVNK